MANVVQCDICGKVQPPEDTKFVHLESTKSLKVYDVTVNNRLSISFDEKDICSSCYEKLKQFFGGEADVVPRHHETAD